LDDFFIEILSKRYNLHSDNFCREVGTHFANEVGIP